MVGACGFVSSIGFFANVFLVLFAMVFIPAVLSIGVGALFLLSPATSGLASVIWDVGLARSASWATCRSSCRATARRSGWSGSSSRSRAGSASGPSGSRPGSGTPSSRSARGLRGTGIWRSQLVNVVQEMAIAAGIPAPEVRLLDAKVANAAAARTDATASYVVVGRRLLDEFDREETEGLLAHLIGSIGNGDLGARPRSTRFSTCWSS